MAKESSTGGGSPSVLPTGAATAANQDTQIANAGTTTDVPLAGEGAEDATARTGTSLWKRMVNKLIDVKALLVKGTAVMANALAVTVATDDTQFGAVGAAAAVSGNVHGQLRFVGEAVAGITLTAKIPDWASAIVATPGTPVSLSSGVTFATSIRIMATQEAGANTGDVYLGESTVDKDTNQAHTLSPGDTWELVAAPGTKFDLNLLFIDCAAGNTDGVTYQYQPA